MTLAVLSLALGIGANTAIFSLIDAIQLRTLPVGNPRSRRISTSRKGPVIDQVFPLTDLRQAFEVQMAGKHFGKISINYRVSKQ